MDNYYRRNRRRCYLGGVSQVTLRDLRRKAAELVRLAENGEPMTIGVSGRPAVNLVPIPAGTWREWSDVAGMFSGPADETWNDDRDLLDAAPSDPWERT